MGKEPIVSREEYQAQTERLYAKIGRVTVEAEHLSYEMFNCSVMILETRGLDQPFAQTALSGHNLESMRRLWESLTKQVYQGDDFAQDLITKLSKWIDTVNQQRNKVVHSLWYIGWGNESTVSYEDALSRQVKRATGKGEQGGLKYSSLKKDAEGFQEIIDALLELTGLVRRLNGCISLSATKEGYGNLEANFHYDEKGILRASRATQ